MSRDPIYIIGAILWGMCFLLLLVLIGIALSKS